MSTLRADNLQPTDQSILIPVSDISTDKELRQDLANPGEGAALVGYDEATNYPDNTVGHKLNTLPAEVAASRDAVRPQDFDPLAGNNDGRDDTAAVQSAINDGRPVDLGEGFNYRCTRLIGRSKLVMLGQSTLDFSGNASYANTVADPLIKIWGSAGAVVLCTANVASGATSLSVASTAGILPGDLIEVATPGNTGGFEDTSVVVHNGEIVQVLDVPNSTTLTLSEPILDASGYTTANNAQIRKLNTVDDVVIGAGITIKGKGRPQPTGAGDNGIVIMYGRRCKVHCNFLQVDLAAVRFEGCYDYEASGGSIRMDLQGANGQVNYGVVPSGSSKHGRVFGWTMHNMRHGVVTSHLSSALGLSVWGVVRDLDVYENTVCNTWHAGLSTHNDCEYVVFRNNTLIGCNIGTDTRDRNVKVINNNMIRCGQAMRISSRPMNQELRGNKAWDCPGSLVNTSFNNTRDITNITVADNEAERCIGGVTFILAAPVTAHRGVYIGGNIFRDIAGGGGNTALVRINGAPVVDSQVDGNKAFGCTGTRGVVIDNGGTRLQITGNNMKGVDGNSFLTQGTFVNSYGKGNFGTSWSGSANMTNGATITGDNTLFV